MDDDIEIAAYVVRNDEEQYSWWPAYSPVPAGWTIVGPSRSKAECLAYIEQVWLDIRPLSMRRASRSEDD
jgi:MbtH protein